MKKQLLTVMLICAVFPAPLRMQAAMDNEVTAADICGCAGVDGILSFKMNNIKSALKSSSEMNIEAALLEGSQEIWFGDGKILVRTKSPYYDGTTLKDPIKVSILKSNLASVKVNYSLYTFKQKFLVDNLYDRLYELGACPDIVLATQAAIDNNLDKIYEFPTVTETASSTERTLYWDGKTDPKFTGQSMPVRACIVLAAHNADTGALISAGVSGRGMQTYLRNNFPKFTVNTDEDGKETLSAEIFMLSDDRPVKLTAMLMTTACRIGVTSYDMSNKGAEAVIASINSSAGGGYVDVAAYTELTNPTVDPKDSRIKIYEWKDIKKIKWDDQKWKDLLKNATGNDGNGKGGWPWRAITELDGDYFAPVEDQYIMGVIVEALDKNGKPIETYIDLNEGFIDYTGFLDVPKLINPKRITTGIPEVKAETWPTKGNFNIYTTAGQPVKSGKLSGKSKEEITTGLRSGIYIITVNTENGGKVAKKIIVNNSGRLDF